MSGTLTATLPSSDITQGGVSGVASIKANTASAPILEAYGIMVKFSHIKGRFEFSDIQNRGKTFYNIFAYAFENLLFHYSIVKSVYYMARDEI